MTGGLALSALAAAALVVPLSLKGRGADDGTAGSVITSGRTANVQVDLAAWSVHTHPDGTVTIVVRQMSDPDGLRKTLARAGVDAIVSVRKAGQPASCSPGGREVSTKGLIVPSSTSTKPGITLRAGAMPKGAKLMVAIDSDVPGHILVQFTVLEGASSSC